MLPSIENLRCFISAARLLNFRRAARQVALTPTAFSQRIRQLEEQVGESLFARTTRSVTLTDAGALLLPEAEECLNAAERCVKRVKGSDELPALELVLGTRHELGLSWLLPEIDRLEKTLPWLTLQLYFGSGTDLLLRVRTLEVDCAITSTRLVDPKLDAIGLHREDYVFVAATSLLKERPFRRGEDAAKHVLFDTGAELPLFRYWRDGWKGAERLEFSRTRYFGTIAAIHARVVAGAGVAVLPLYLVQKELQAKRLQRVLPSVVAQHDFFRLVFRAQDPRRRAFDALAQQLVRAPLR